MYVFFDGSETSASFGTVWKEAYSKRYRFPSRIFGPSLPAFQAIREVLLAGDTNRISIARQFV